MDNPEGKRLSERTWRRWEYINEIDFQEVGCEGMDSFYLAKNRERWRALVTAVTKSSGSIKRGEFLE